MIEWVAGSSVLIAIVITMRFMLRGKISSKLQYALWGLVFVRLLVPFSIESGLSVTNTLQKVSVVQDAESIKGVDRIAHMEDGSVEGYYASDYMRDFPTIVAEKKTSAEYARMRRILSLREVLVPVWLGGMALMFVGFAVSNTRFASRLRRDRTPFEVESSSVPVYISAIPDTPCLFGILSPAIYLTPEVADDPAILRYAIEHETTHFRRGDNLWSFLRAVALILHWYNPLVWWAALLSHRDAELSCDEATIQRIGESERAEYGRTLIRMSCRKRPALLMTATTMTGGTTRIKERILLLAQKPHMAPYTLVGVLLIAAVAVGCTFTGAKNGSKPADTGRTLYETGEYSVAIPTEHIDRLIIQTRDETGHDTVLLSVHEKGSVQAAETDGLTDSGLGWLFSLVRYDRVQYERYLCEDGSGRGFFAKDDDWYYGYATATDVRYYRRGGDHSADLALWDTLNDELGPWVCDDFVTRNKLEAYSDLTARAEYTYDGEHRFLNYYPHYSVNESKDEVFLLVLSQPARQGAGGIWCVERMLDEHANVYLWFPDSGMPATEYYAGLQAECDAAQSHELLDVYGAARAFLYETGYFGSPVIEGSLEETDAPARVDSRSEADSPEGLFSTLLDEQTPVRLGLTILSPEESEFMGEYDGWGAGNDVYLSNQLALYAYEAVALDWLPSEGAKITLSAVGAQPRWSVDFYEGSN